MAEPEALVGEGSGMEYTHENFEKLVCSKTVFGYFYGFKTFYSY